MPSPTSMLPDAKRTQEEIDAELSTIVDPVEGEGDDDSEVLDPATGKSKAKTTPDDEAADLVRATEKEATKKGWVPKDQYKGDPAKWVDARTFIDRGERFNQNLQRELAGMRKKLQEFEGTKKAFVKFHEETIAAKDKELAKAINDLRVARSEATADGDHEGAVALEDRIDLLRDERKKLKETPAEQQEEEDGPDGSKAKGPNPTDPVLVEWIADGNEWFDDDPAMRAYAIAVGEGLIKGDPDQPRGRKFLDKVRAKMEEEFPRKFKAKTPAREKTDPAEGGGKGGNSGSGKYAGGKTEADLPAEDRRLMRQYIAEGWTTKEKFLTSYWERNA